MLISIKRDLDTEENKTTRQNTRGKRSYRNLDLKKPTKASFEERNCSTTALSKYNKVLLLSSIKQLLKKVYWICSLKYYSEENVLGE